MGAPLRCHPRPNHQPAWFITNCPVTITQAVTKESQPANHDERMQETKLAKFEVFVRASNNNILLILCSLEHFLVIVKFQCSFIHIAFI